MTLITPLSSLSIIKHYWVINDPISQVSSAPWSIYGTSSSYCGAAKWSDRCLMSCMTSQFLTRRDLNHRFAITKKQRNWRGLYSNYLDCRRAAISGKSCTFPTRILPSTNRIPFPRFLYQSSRCACCISSRPTRYRRSGMISSQVRQSSYRGTHQQL